MTLLQNHSTANSLIQKKNIKTIPTQAMRARSIHFNAHLFALNIRKFDQRSQKGHIWRIYMVGTLSAVLMVFHSNYSSFPFLK